MLAFRSMVEVVSTEVCIGCSVLEHVVNRREDRGSDGSDRLLTAASGSETQVLGREVPLLDARR